MLTVRYPNGVAVTYNTANFLSRETDAWNLYTTDPMKGGEWVATIQLSAGCVVESVRACRVENLLTGMTLPTAADLVLENLRELDYRHLKALKIALKNFDARTGNWNGSE